MIETSASTAKLDAALAKAQGSFVSAHKENVASVKSDRGSYSYSYADLAGIWKACRASLSQVGISATQWLVSGDDNRLHIVTRLACEGEWMMARWSMPVSKQDPQGYGSAATYARRYALAAALGVVADEDDDGNAASEKPRQSARAAMQRAKEESPGSRGAADRKAAGARAPSLDGDRAPPTPSSPDLSKPSSDEEWKVRIQLAGSVSVEELDSLQPEIDAVPDEMLRGRLRRYRDEIRKRAIARAEAKRIAKGEPPTSSVPDDGGAAS